MNNDYEDIVSAEDLAEALFNVVLTDEEKLAYKIKFYEYCIEKTKKRLLHKKSGLTPNLQRTRVVRLVKTLDKLETKLQASKNDFFCATKEDTANE